MAKTAILIGFGGMGQRYFKALKLMNFDILAICDKNKKKLVHSNLKVSNITSNYKQLLSFKADLLCVASNTQSRFEIISSFCKKGKIKKIVTEKPLCTSYENCLNLKKICKKNKVRLNVNTHRSFSPNYQMVKNIFKKFNETPSSIIINSPSAGLGNMGSTFFDLGFYFFKKKAISVVGWIDKTGTISPRGKQFVDPGGYGILNFSNNKKLFFDLSEDTGLPYLITIKSKNLEVVIDEINNNFYLKKRPTPLRKKPLFFYLFKPTVKKLKIKHKFDVIKMTCFTIKNIFKKNHSYENFENAIATMACIFATHVSNRKKKIIKLPLNKKYHKFKLNFA